LLAYLDHALVIKNQNDVARLYTLPDLTDGKPEPLFKYNYGITSLGHNSLLICGDSAIIYDYKADRTIATFVGGVNHGIAQAAISHDHKWVVTVDPNWNAKLWRASDGQLTMTFHLPGEDWGSCAAEFSSSDRYLLFACDTALFLRDLTNGETKELLHLKLMNAWLQFSSDGSKFVVSNWNEGISMYEIPSVFQDSTQPLDPKTVYLPLRFYMPADAPEAIDTNGKPYNPPRTHVELELRYADGSLLKKILDGAYHKGKWGIWEYDMTSYPKGTYIMHTEIGGVVKDEKMDVR
jgi:hypothetical protein